MADIKWIKLSVNTFDDEKIKLIRTVPEGDKIALIWIQILCLAGKINDGGWVYMGQNLAYSDEMLAAILNHPLNTMRIALQTLEQFGMIDVKGDGMIDVINWEKHQSTDKMNRIANQNRERQQKHYYRTRLRDLGVDVDAKGFTGNSEELKQMYESMTEEPNVRVTLANATEVRSKKKEVRSKKKEVNNSRQSSKRRYDHDSPYLQLAQHLFGFIKQRDEKAKEPNFQTWADDIRKLVELDDRSVEEVGRVIDWCQKDTFWQNNILSARKLRSQFGQLYLQMTTPKKQQYRKGSNHKEIIPSWMKEKETGVKQQEESATDAPSEEYDEEAMRRRINELIEEVAE